MRAPRVSVLSLLGIEQLLRMQELFSSDSQTPIASADQTTRSEKKHRYWNKFREKVKRTDKGRHKEYPHGNDSVARPDRTNDPTPARATPLNRKRAKSLGIPRQPQPSKASAPRSIKFLGLTNVTTRKGFFKRSPLRDRQAHEAEEYDEIPDPSKTELSAVTSSEANHNDADDSSVIGKRHLSLRAMRQTKGNETMLFKKDISMCSPLSNRTSNSDKQDSRHNEALHKPSLTDNISTLGSRTKSLLDLATAKKKKERRISSVVGTFLPSDSCAEKFKEEHRDRDDGFETGSCHSEKESRSSHSERSSGFGTLPNLRLLFKNGISQDRTKSGHYSTGSAGVRSYHRHILGKGSNKNNLIRRSSSLPGSLHKDCPQENAYVPNQTVVTLASEDALQSPWGIRADQSDDSSRRGSITLVSRMADISQVMHGLTRRHGKDLNSGSIHLSDEDDVRCERVSGGSAKEPVEMFEDDFVEYTVKKARKQRK